MTQIDRPWHRDLDTQSRGTREIEVLSKESRSRHTAQQRRRSEAFLRGPVPLSWLHAAGRVDGKTLQVAIAIWYRVGLEGSVTVQLPPSVTRAFGVSRQARYRALNALEAAGLIRQTRAPGRSSMVTVLETPLTG